MRNSISITTITILILALTAIFISGCNNNKQSSSLQTAKVYVANEGDGTISVIDLQDSLKVTNIIINDNSGDKFMPHNVQVAPDGNSVWVTIVAVDSNVMDQLVVIDPTVDEIKKRIPLGKGLHVAHVVLDNESKHVFVTAQNANQLFQVDASTYEVLRKFELREGYSPHGLRYSNDRLYVANMGSKSMSIINVSDGEITDIPLGGVAVQTAVTQDGKFVFISLYDTKEVVRYDLQSGEITRISLPAEAQGAIQLYATPNSKLLYVADQGELMQRAVSNKVYVIDIPNATVAETIEAGNKAHGVVVSNDGKTVFVTNSLDNTVSIIDVATQKVTATVPVGKSPNGISYWSENNGMP